MLAFFFEITIWNLCHSFVLDCTAFCTPLSFSYITISSFIMLKIYLILHFVSLFFFLDSFWIIRIYHYRGSLRYNLYQIIYLNNVRIKNENNLLHWKYPVILVLKQRRLWWVFVFSFVLPLLLSFLSTLIGFCGKLHLQNNNGLVFMFFNAHF